ncbi:MAG TPA: arginase family protein [Ktedonobacteraceae bacterium]|jgi:arginase|nr:arginase family protein [Ktedonobacteraceae bacterium]
MQISIICVPYQMDFTRWGCANGPQAFLDNGLITALEQKGHSVSAPQWIELPKAERTRDTVTNLSRIAARTASAVRSALEQENGFALVLAGDCTHAVGSIGGLTRAKGAAGVVWFDAHGDLNTRETSNSGFWGGMPYAVALGWDLDDWRLAAGLEPPVRPEAAALIGASDLDPAEVEALQRHPIANVDARALGEPGVTGRIQAALQARIHEAPAWYVHFDLDVGGPEECPGGLTPAPYWPPREHIIEAAHATAQTLPVKVATLAVYNPAADETGRGVRFGLDMILALLGEL